VAQLYPWALGLPCLVKTPSTSRAEFLYLGLPTGNTLFSRYYVVASCPWKRACFWRNFLPTKRYVQHYISSTYSTVSSTQLWLCRSNFFIQSKNNSFVCAASLPSGSNSTGPWDRWVICPYFLSQNDWHFYLIILNTPPCFVIEEQGYFNLYVLYRDPGQLSH
jgi:hypothetical protein